MLNRMRTARGRFSSRQRGLSLVELMVGIAVGLFVVAAATMLVSTQLNENRRLILETQVQQDLRAASDIITRELRRSGHWSEAARFFRIDEATPPADNIHADLDLDVGNPDIVGFEYYRGPSDTGPYGFKWEGNVLKTRLAGGGWQDLTDGNTLRITAFSVLPRTDPAPALAVLVPCTKKCLGGGTACWPTRTVTVRELVIDIAGESVVDPTVKRRLQSAVRLRNDLVSGDPSAACPA